MASGEESESSVDAECGDDAVELDQETRLDTGGINLVPAQEDGTKAEDVAEPLELVRISKVEQRLDAAPGGTHHQQNDALRKLFVAGEEGEEQSERMSELSQETRLDTGTIDIVPAQKRTHALRRAVQRQQMLKRAFDAAVRGRSQEKTLRAALTLALCQKMLKCHVRLCAELGEQAAVDLGPEELKLQAAGELFELWAGATKSFNATNTGNPNTSTGSVKTKESKPETSKEPAVGDTAASNVTDAPVDNDEAMLTEAKLVVALSSMKLPPKQELLDEFVGEQPHTLQRAGPVSLDKKGFIARLFDIVNPEADMLVQTNSRRWAPWSLFGFSCNCLPWGSTRVTVSNQGDITVARSGRALLCRGGYRRVDAFDISTSKWIQIRKNFVHSSDVAAYIIEGLLVFVVCATFFAGDFATMTAVSSLAGLGWLGFRIAVMMFRQTSSATIYATGLPSSLTGGSAGSFEIPRAECHRLLDAFVTAKVGKPVASTATVLTSYVCPRPAVFFAERCIKLNAPHKLTLGTGKQHYIIEKVADASPPCCRSFSQTTWHAGMISDIPWIHTHLSERELGTLCRGMLKGLAAALALSFLIASFVPECHGRSPCDDEVLNAKVARLPPFSNVSGTDCKRPFDFSHYESSEPLRREEMDAAFDAEMDCNRKASQGHCSPTHPEHFDMLVRCRPTCGECLEDHDVSLSCDERCQDFSCGDFTCGAVDMRRNGDTNISQTLQIVYGKTCNFAGGGTNDGVCDEAVGWCLPGTDHADCEGSQNYIDNLFNEYKYADVKEHRHLSWYAPIAEANDIGCRLITVLERCAACRSPAFACSAYNVSSDFPDVRASCLEIETADVLYATPWCQAAAIDHMFPACSCLPPYLRPLPNWKVFVAILAFILALIWIPTVWRWVTYRRCFTEFGALGVDTTRSGHALKFHTTEGARKQIAMQVMEQKLGRPLNHELIKTYEYITPKLRRPFNVGRQEKLHVHADYLVVETVTGRGLCNFWTRSPARDFYYVLLKDTTFVESGQIGEPFMSQVAKALLTLGFMIMFSSYAGGILSYVIKRWHIPPERVTLGKWAGLSFGVGLFFLIRAAAGILKQRYLHVGCMAGGTDRGRRNPHGGFSPFFIQINNTIENNGQDEDKKQSVVEEIKGVIIATRRQSKAAALETDMKVPTTSVSTNCVQLSQPAARKSIRDLEAQVKAGLLDEHANVMTAKDIRLRAIEDAYRHLDTDNSGSLSVDEIAHATALLGIEMDIGLIMKEWDTDRSGSLERAEFFSMMLKMLDPKNHIATFSAQEHCRMQFYGIDFDWIPWGQRSTKLNRVNCSLTGKSGFGGLPLFADEHNFDIDVLRMRWLMLDQNPVSMNKFNSYMAEALTLYTFRSKIAISPVPRYALISQLRVLAHQEPRTTGSVVALVWLVGRFTHLFMRARAHVRVHATGVPAGSMTIPHKGTFPVDLGSSNSLIGEFLHVKGVVSDAPTTEIVALVEPRHTVFSCKCCPGHETHRMLLIGDSHFAFEKVAGDHRQPRHRQDDDAVAADSLATNESPGHNHTVDDQFSEPFDVANKRLLLAPARTFRRRVLAGLIQDVYWVAMSRRSLSLSKLAHQVFYGIVFSLLFALPISLISSKTNCKNSLDLHNIMGGREYDTSEQIPADQLENFKRWCAEFPLDLGNPVIPYACTTVHRVDFIMPDQEAVDMVFSSADEDGNNLLSRSELELVLDTTLHNQQNMRIFGIHLSVGDIFQTYDENGNGLIDSNELYQASIEAMLNRRMDPAQYVRDKTVWCKQFGEARGNDPCECNWWRHHLPDWPVLAAVWGVVSFFYLLHIIRGVCRKQRFYAEMGIAGFPNQAASHMAKMKIPEDQMDAIPFRVLESRLGRKLNKKKILNITYKPPIECCKQGQVDVLHIYEDYLHLETFKGRCCLKRMCCCCDANKMETDDYYVLLRDTGFMEIVEENSVAKAVARCCLILTLLCVMVDVFLKWLLTVPNPSVFNWSASTIELETIDVTIGRVTRIGIVLLPVMALLAYWIGAKLRVGYIHIGVRPGGTHRGFINRFGSTSPFYFRVRASSEVEMHGDAADTPCAMDKFSEPYLSVVHALRSARARSRQMDAVVSLNRQASAGKACFALSGEGAMGQFAQGQLDVATAALGVAPVRSVAAARLAPKVIVEFAEGDLQSKAFESLGDAAIGFEDIASSFWGDK